MSETIESTQISQKQRKQTQNIKETTDLYSVCRQSIDKYFKSTKANTLSYLQSISDLQEEIVEARKKNADSVILLQKTIAESSGNDPKIPKASLDLATKFSEQTAKAWNFQNQLMLASLEAMSKNIRAFNENAETFSELNAKLLDSWMNVIKKATKE